MRLDVVVHTLYRRVNRRRLANTRMRLDVVVHTLNRRVNRRRLADIRMCSQISVHPLRRRVERHRLGKQDEVRIFYLAYAGTVSHDKLKQLASQGGAAALFSGNTPQGGLAEHVGADQGALVQIAQKLCMAGDLTVAFARRHAELVSAIATGRDWLGIDHDSLPDRMAFMRSLPHQALWLPPITRVVRHTTESKPSKSATSVRASVGQKATVTFGNLADIGKALRTARKARREDMEQQAEAFGPPMFEL